MAEQVFAITSDLCSLPIVFCSAASVEELCEQLGMWHEAGGLTAEEEALLYNFVKHAQAPNDGLLGTAVTEQFTLPGLNGMRIHIQVG